jgi:hypothetical protein
MQKGQMVLKTISAYKRMKLDPYLTSNIEINSKWNEDLNVTTKIRMLSEENIGTLAYQ